MSGMDIIVRLSTCDARPAVVSMDIRMPDPDNIQATGLHVSKCPNFREHAIQRVFKRVPERPLHPARWYLEDVLAYL